jgi:hypothetical protein
MFILAKTLPGMLIAYLHSSWRFAGMTARVTKVADYSLIFVIRLNATVFGFSPNIIFSVDSAAKKAIAISP